MSLIDDYTIELSTPDCDLGSPVLRAIVGLGADISEALPFMNATVEKAEFIPGIPVLVWTEDSHRYALRAREIAISNIEDRRQAEILVRALADRVNAVWDFRNDIEPSFESYERPKVLDLLRLLPRTNCRECGLPSCMAFADALSKDKKTLEECPAVLEEKCAQQLGLLREMGL